MGDVSFNLEIFNGTALESVCKGDSKNGEIQIHLTQAIDFAYRFKITLDKNVSDNMEIQVYNL